jgi:hypothetical protein
MKEAKTVIGRRDRIDLPEVGITGIRAKIDSGAYGCAIHCSDIGIISKDGKERLSFVLLDPEHPQFTGTVHSFEHFRDKKVKNSGGETEHRYSVVTDVVIFGQRIRTEFSLTDRSSMRYPILLGRKFLRGRFLVDVSLRDVSHKKRK